METLMDALKALSDETRLRIINLLFVKELCVCDIIRTLRVPQAKASRHLIYLKNAGLVRDRKHAQWVYYSIVKDERMSFLEDLVQNNLRRIELYRSDLDRLKEWLDNKNIICD